MQEPFIAKLQLISNHGYRRLIMHPEHLSLVKIRRLEARNRTKVHYANRYVSKVIKFFWFKNNCKRSWVRQVHVV